MEARLMITDSATLGAMATCAGLNCTYRGPDSGLYVRGDRKLCGACMDRADDEDMPYLTSEFSWRIIRDLEDR